MQLTNISSISFQFRALTGLDSPAVFEALLKFLITYDDEVELVYYHSIDQKYSRFSREEQLLMTLAKLRTGETDLELAVLFKVKPFNFIVIL